MWLFWFLFGGDAAVTPGGPHALWQGDGSYLGRFHVGQSIPLGLASMNTTRVPTAPDEAPLAKIYNASGTLQETIDLPLASAAKFYFQKRSRLGSGYSAGRHFVIYQWLIGGVTYQVADTFDVLSGGDADGGVIAMDVSNLPTGRHVVFETETGTLKSGRNPRR